MQKKIKKRLFLVDEHAISEEFTTLPALSVVMIGFALFIVLLAQTYSTYEERIAQLQNYQTADGIAHKLTNPDSYFIRDDGLIDVAILESDMGPLQKIQEEYHRSGVSFLLRLRWYNITKDFPAEQPATSMNRLAVSKEVGIYLNPAQTVPGTITIILWRGIS
jgi:hypothetical protein